MNWHAKYYDGRNQRPEPVTAAIADAGLRIHRADGSFLWWYWSEIRCVPSSVSGGPYRVERRGASRERSSELLLVTDAGLVEALRRVAPSVVAANRTAARSAPWKAMATMAVAVVSGAVALYVWGLPYMARLAAQRVPPDWEEKLGRATMKEMTRVNGICRDPAVNEPLERIVRRLESRIETAHRFQVFVSGNREINASALPGGFVVVNRGLLENTRAPEELAAVLGHELTHVAERHSTQTLIRSLGVWAALSMFLGNMQGTLTRLAGALSDLSFSRQQEQEADAGAMQLFEELKLDPRAMVEVFRMLESKGGDTPEAARYFSSHPSLRERLARIQSWAARAEWRPSPLLPGRAWPPVVRPSCLGP